MQKLYTPARMVVIFIVMAIVLTVYVSALYNVQVYQPRLHDSDRSQGRIITRTSTIAAARGNIYDRNGVLLASGRPSHDIRLDWFALRGMPETNDVVLELIYATMDEGFTYNDTFPVTRGAPFEYLSNMSSVQRNRLNAYFEYHGLDPEIEVSELLAWFRDHYKIHYTIGILDARLIIGVRYELEIRVIMGSITPYVFAADVSSDFVAYLAERGLTGVYVETSYAREYHTMHAPHLLGYIGRMTAEEYAVYKELGYPMDALVGKIGAEYAFEELLHGSEGVRTVSLNEEGTVFRDEVTTQPEPGRHIYLTLDLGVQASTEQALRSHIETQNFIRREEEANRSDDDEEELELITGGAAVVTLVNTGEILAAASYPTFNLLTLSDDWAVLNTDPNFPMLNRATQGIYAPGSTFKMVTALAALRNISFINRYYGIDDTGRFDKYEDVGEGFVATCWIFSQSRVGHRMLDIVQALECSCNYYFIQVSDWLAGGNAENAGIMLAEAAMEFGLGITTGLELPERAGRLPTKEAKAIIKPTEGWYTADVLMAGFGQGESRFTPVQLANYAATIGNGGTLYSLSFLRRVVSADYTETFFEQSPQILNQIEETEYIEILQEGMLAVSMGRAGTAREIFRNYRIPVAAKTGTVQIAGRRINDGVFVCYAPANNPEIAISIVVENGGSGSQIMAIARTIMDYYFVTESSFLATPYGQMIP